MGRLAIEEVSAGQTASRPVINANGMLLVQAGTVLTDSLIARLKALGVASVIVSGADGPGQERSADEQLRDVEHRFQGLEDDALMMQIKQLAVEQVGGGGN